MKVEDAVREWWRRAYWRAFNGNMKWGISKEENLITCNQYIQLCCGTSQRDLEEDFATDFRDGFFIEYGKVLSEALDELMESKEGDAAICKIKEEVRLAALKWWRANTGKDGRCTL